MSNGPPQIIVTEEDLKKRWNKNGKKEDKKRNDDTDTSEKKADVDEENTKSDDEGQNSNLKPAIEILIDSDSVTPDVSAVEPPEGARIILCTRWLCVLAVVLVLFCEL